MSLRYVAYVYISLTRIFYAPRGEEFNPVEIKFHYQWGIKMKFHYPVLSLLLLTIATNGTEINADSTLSEFSANDWNEDGNDAIKVKKIEWVTKDFSDTLWIKSFVGLEANFF